MSDETTTNSKPKQKVSNHKRVGYGRRRLDNADMLEQIVRLELEALFKKVRGNKKKGREPQHLTPEEAKTLEAITKAQGYLDKLKVQRDLATAEAEAAAEEFTPEELRRTMNELKKQAAAAQEE